MPTYDYRCRNGHDSEQFFRKMSDAPTELVCPVCGVEAVRRVSGGAGLVFKGSGFYLTDYGKNAHRRPAADGAKGDGAGDAKSDTKGDGKAEGSKAENSAPSGGSDSGPPTPAAKPDSTKSESTTASPKRKSGDGQ